MPRLMTSTPTLALLGDLPLHLGKEIGSEKSSIRRENRCSPPRCRRPSSVTGGRHLVGVTRRGVGRSRPREAGPGGPAREDLLGGSGMKITAREPRHHHPAPLSLHLDGEVPTEYVHQHRTGHQSQRTPLRPRPCTGPTASLCPAPLSRTRVRADPSRSTARTPRSLVGEDTRCRSITAPTAATSKPAGSSTRIHSAVAHIHEREGIVTSSDRSATSTASVPSSADDRTLAARGAPRRAPGRRSRSGSAPSHVDPHRPSSKGRS